MLVVFLFMSAVCNYEGAILIIIFVLVFTTITILASAVVLVVVVAVAAAVSRSPNHFEHNSLALQAMIPQS